MTLVPPERLAKLLARATVKTAAYAILAFPLAFVWSWLTRGGFIVHYASLLAALLIVGVMRRYLRAPASR